MEPISLRGKLEKGYHYLPRIYQPLTGPAVEKPSYEKAIDALTLKQMAV